MGDVPFRVSLILRQKGAAKKGGDNMSIVESTKSRSGPEGYWILSFAITTSIYTDTTATTITSSNMW
jgi:hypothetical protein